MSVAAVRVQDGAAQFDVLAAGAEGAAEGSWWVSGLCLMGKHGEGWGG